MKEKLSLLMDDELDEADKADVIDAIQKDPDLQGCWQRYHLISQMIKQKDSLYIEPKLTDQVSQALVNEPVLNCKKPNHFLKNFTIHGVGMTLAASVAVLTILFFQNIPMLTSENSPQVAINNNSVYPHDNVMNALSVKSDLEINRQMIPSGYRLSQHQLNTAKPGALYEYMVLSNGVNPVSVYVKKNKPTTNDSMNPVKTNTYIRKVGNYQITVVGDVSGDTLETISHAIELNLK